MSREIECTKCNWYGYREDRFRNLKGFMCCPNCHNKEFYQLTPNPITASSGKSAVGKNKNG